MFNKSLKTVELIFFNIFTINIHLTLELCLRDSINQQLDLENYKYEKREKTI